MIPRRSSTEFSNSFGDFFYLNRNVLHPRNKTNKNLGKTLSIMNSGCDEQDIDICMYICN